MSQVNRLSRNLNPSLNESKACTYHCSAILLHYKCKMQKFHVTIPTEVGDTSNPLSISFHLNVVLEKFIMLTLV